MTGFKKDIYYSKKAIAKAINCSPSWTNMILERPEFFKFRKLTPMQYAQNPVYVYLYCDELIAQLKKLYRPRGSKFRTEGFNE